MAEGLRVNIDHLIEIVIRGGAVKTGINIYDSNGILLLEKDVLVNRVTTLLQLKSMGIADVPFESRGGIWNSEGDTIQISTLQPTNEAMAAAREAASDFQVADLGNKIQQVRELKKQARQVQESARESVTRVFEQVKQRGGGFEQEMLDESVATILGFLQSHSSACAFLSREIFSHGDYLYSHSVNVCTLGSALLKKFNDEFNQFVNRHLVSYGPAENLLDYGGTSFVLYQPEEIHELSLGYFLHDIGQTMVPDSILNKAGSLCQEEFDEIKKHSSEYGAWLLDKNKIHSSMVRNIVAFHHAPLFFNEERTYPSNKSPIEIPIYVKICKLADIFDAMTSKRAYRDAINPVSVVTEIVRKYSNKDSLLQMLLMVLLKTIGVYPPGSVIHLRNEQLAYVLDPNGPIVIIFTDSFGNVLDRRPEPINLGEAQKNDFSGYLQIDRRKPLLSPKEYYHILPPYLRE